MKKHKTSCILQMFYSLNSTEFWQMSVKLTWAVVRKSWGKGAVAPPVLGGGAAALGKRRYKKSALQVLLEQLACDVGLTGRDQVKVCRVAILLHAVRSQRPRLGAQALTDHPALHSRMETILEKHLKEKHHRGNQWMTAQHILIYFTLITVSSPAAWVEPQSCREKLSLWHNRKTKHPPPPQTGWNTNSSQ